MRKFISLKNLKRIGGGCRGSVFKIDDKILIKISNKDVSYEAIEKEYNNFKNAYLAGVHTSNAYEIVDTEEGTGFTFDYLQGESIIEKINKNPYKFLSYFKLWGKEVRNMHNKKVKGECFESQKEIELKSFDKEEKDELINIIYNLYEWIPESNNFIHGDPNIKNFLFTDNKGFVIDLADATYGNPIFDLVLIKFMLTDQIDFIFILKEKYKNVKVSNYNINKMISSNVPKLMKNKILRKINWAVFLSSYLRTNIFSKKYNKANSIISLYVKIQFLLFVNLLHIYTDVSYSEGKCKKYIEDIISIYNKGKENLWGDFQFV